MQFIKDFFYTVSFILFCGALIFIITFTGQHVGYWICEKLEKIKNG